MKEKGTLSADAAGKARSETKSDDNYTLKDVLGMVGQIAKEVQNQQTVIQQLLERGNGDGFVGDIDEEDKAHARVHLVNHMYNTPDSKLPQLTVTPRAMVLPMAIEATWVEFIERVKIGEKPFLLDIFMRKVDERMRSVDGRWSTDALVMSQAQEETESARAMNEGGI